jgi:hypothetical protein
MLKLIAAFKKTFLHGMIENGVHRVRRVEKRTYFILVLYSATSLNKMNPRHVGCYFR